MNQIGMGHPTLHGPLCRALQMQAYRERDIALAGSSMIITIMNSFVFCSFVEGVGGGGGGGKDFLSYAEGMRRGSTRCVL